MDLEFRDEKDAALLTRLTRYVYDAHHRRHPEIFKPFDFEAIRAWYERVLAREHTAGLVAYLHGEPVGYALLVHQKKRDNPFVVENYEILFVDQMCVKEGFQSRGIGARIMEEVFARARDLGVKRVELTVWVDNVGARAFYDRMGFEVYLEKRGKDL